MRIVIFILLLINGTIISSQEQLASNLNVKFTIKNFGANVEGSFKESSVTGKFDRNDLDNSSFNVTIQVRSIGTGNKKRDKHLLEPVYFDVSRYPEIKFSSTSIKRISANSYRLSGELNIKNKTRIIDIPLSVTPSQDKFSVRSYFELSRKDFGVGKRSWILSDKVMAQVYFTINNE